MYYSVKAVCKMSRSVFLSRHFVLNRYLFRCYCVVLDRNFDFFRSKAEYRNLVVTLNPAGAGVPDLALSLFLKEKKIQTEDFYSLLMQREHVMKLSNAHVKDILGMMANTKIDTVKYATALRYLDEKCTLSVDRWPVDLSFYVLDAFFIILGTRVFRKHYYLAITDQWSRRIRKYSKSNFLLMLYFIGMSKTAPPFIMEAIEDRLERCLDQLSDEEAALVCLCFFKTSTPLKSEAILKRSAIAVGNLMDQKDRFNVISILKCFRLSRYYDAPLWQRVKEYITRESDSFNFVECTNFLAFFASQSMYNIDLFNTLEERSISVLLDEESTIQGKNKSEIIKLHPSTKSRAKDVARFLWSCTSMGHVFNANTLRFITKDLMGRMEFGEFETQPHILVDCLQSLVLANVYPPEILPSVLNKSYLKQISQTTRAKPKYQLYFVQKSVEIERPRICSTELSSIYCPIPKNLDKEVQDREGFRELLDLLGKTPSVIHKACYLMPHIMIAGILVCNRTTSNSATKNTPLYKTYIEREIVSKDVKEILLTNCDVMCIEILDSSVCVNGGSSPHGLMRTKIRQLGELKLNVVLLTKEEIVNLVQEDVSHVWEVFQNLAKK